MAGGSNPPGRAKTFQEDTCGDACVLFVVLENGYHAVTIFLLVCMGEGAPVRSVDRSSAPSLRRARCHARTGASFSPRRYAGLRGGAVPRAPFPPSPEKLTKISHKPARTSGSCGSFPYGGQPTAAADPTIWPRTVERIAWKNGIRAGATPLLHTPRDNRNTAPRPLRGIAPCTGGFMEYRHA